MNTISSSKSTSNVIFVITEVTKLNLQAYSNKYYCNNMEILQRGENV